MFARCPRAAVLPLFATLALASQAYAQSPPHDAHASVPRYLYVAAPPGEHIDIPYNDYGTTLRLAKSLPSGAQLQQDNPTEGLFYTVDTTFLAKAPVRIGHEGGTYRYNEEIPPAAIVSAVQVTNGGRMPMLAVGVNLNHVESLLPGVAPRAPSKGIDATAQLLHPPGPEAGNKLILNADFQPVAAAVTPMDELHVMLHGTPTAFMTSTAYGSQRAMPVRQLADVIRGEIARRGLPPSIRIRLYACQSGSRPEGDPRGAAQSLADALVDAQHPDGFEVIAPTGYGFSSWPTIEHADGTREIFGHPVLVTEDVTARPGEHPPVWRTYRGRGVRLASEHVAAAPAPHEAPAPAPRAGGLLGASRSVHATPGPRMMAGPLGAARAARAAAGPRSMGGPRIR